MPDAADHILEAKIRAAQRGPSLDGWIDELAAGTPAPGGGSAAALAGVIAAALVAMVCRLTIGRKAYASVESQAQEILQEAENLRRMLRAQVDDDAASYEAVMAAYRLRKDDPQRAGAMDRALFVAAMTPLNTAQAAVTVGRLAQIVGAIGNKNVRSDATVAASLARSAAVGALENVRVNLEALSDPSLGADLHQVVAGLERELATPTS